MTILYIKLTIDIVLAVYCFAFLICCCILKQNCFAVQFHVSKVNFQKMFKELTHDHGTYNYIFFIYINQILFIYRWIFPACNEEARICKAVQDIPGHQNEWTWKTGIRIFFSILWVIVHVVLVDIMELVLNLSVLLNYTLLRQYYILLI